MNKKIRIIKINMGIILKHNGGIVRFIKSSSAKTN